MAIRNRWIAMFMPILVATVIAVTAPNPQPTAWPNAGEAALAAAHRYTIVGNMLHLEVGVAILYNARAGTFTYSGRVHYGDNSVTIDLGDPQDVPPGYVFVGTWHSHSFPGYEGLEGHDATIRTNRFMVIWTSYAGYVVEQFWDPTLNNGRGGVHRPVNICPNHANCVPVVDT